MSRLRDHASWNQTWNQLLDPGHHAAMPKAAKGHIEQLPSGSFRVVVFAGYDPATRRRLYFKSTVKTEPQAQIELGKPMSRAATRPAGQRAAPSSVLLTQRVATLTLSCRFH
jgi:hypothetical protein